MKHNQTIIQKITTNGAAVAESLQQIPVAEIAGDHRVLIENHKGVMEYGKERIGVKVSFGRLTVLGTGLQLVQITKEQLVILGKIDCVSLCREDK